MIMKIAIYCNLFFSLSLSLFHFIRVFASEFNQQQSYIAAVLVSSLVITSALVQESNDDDEQQGKDHTADSSIYAPDWV